MESTVSLCCAEITAADIVTADRKTKVAGAELGRLRRGQGVWYHLDWIKMRRDDTPRADTLAFAGCAIQVVNLVQRRFDGVRR